MKRKRPYHFAWVDDDEKKVNDYKPVIENVVIDSFLPAEVDLVLVDSEFYDQLPKFATQSAPDLVIIDHLFTQAPHLPLNLKGSSLAHLLRSVWPDVPMVCVTGMLLNNPTLFDQEDISEYLAVFPYSDLNHHLEDLFIIARDFTKIKITSADLVEAIMKALKVPAVDKEAFSRALPEEFHNKTHHTTRHRLASWIYRTFLPRPGFLYDELRVATYLGLKVSGYRKVASIFEKAGYHGPFTSSSEPRWWVSLVQDILYQNTPLDGPTQPQLAGRSLPGITSADFSLCYVAGKKSVPDVVARLPGTKEWQAVSSEFTEQDPEDISLMAGFDSLFIMVGEK